MTRASIVSYAMAQGLICAMELMMPVDFVTITQLFPLTALPALGGQQVHQALALIASYALAVPGLRHVLENQILMVPAITIQVSALIAPLVISQVLLRLLIREVQVVVALAVPHKGPVGKMRSVTFKTDHVALVSLVGAYLVVL